MIYLNGDPINVTRFPDNTTQVWKIDEEHLRADRANIDWKYSYEGELLEIAQLKDLLEAYGKKKTHLYIDYLPFARQDHPVSNGTTFALHSFAKLLNAIEFDYITIEDPHSEMALELIKNSHADYPRREVRDCLDMVKAAYVCYPDKGARRKYTDLYSHSSIYGEKVRDLSTGHITNYELHLGNRSIEDKSILIVDDICDGGKTFELLAVDLYRAGASEVHLFVSHGLFTKGLAPLRDAGIHRIFTKDGELTQMNDGGFGVKGSNG